MLFAEDRMLASRCLQKWATLEEPAPPVERTSGLAILATACELSGDYRRTITAFEVIINGNEIGNPELVTTRATGGGSTSFVSGQIHLKPINLRSYPSGKKKGENVG
jgi:hypothetical protein